MPGLQDWIADMQSHNYSQQDIQAEISKRQLQGAIRPWAMTGSEALSGLENTLTMPQRGMNWVGRNAIDPVSNYLGGDPNLYEKWKGSPLPTPVDLQNWTNRVGFTNNPSLVPGYGPNPGSERIMAGSARGIGGNLVFGPMAALLGGLAGGTGEAVSQATGSQALGTLAGTGVGLAGGFTGIGKPSAELEAPPPLSVDEMKTNIKNVIGPSDATLYSAGQNLQDELSNYKPGAILPVNIHNKLVNAQNPGNAVSSILNDPKTLSVIRQRLPDVADQIAVGALDRNLSQVNNLFPESKAQLYPDLGTQQMISDASLASKGPRATPVAPPSPGVSEPLLAYGLGGLGMLGAHYMGYFPGIGEAGAEAIGSTGMLALDMLKSRVAAHAVLDPYIRNSMAQGMVGGSAGAALPPGQQ